ncbi:hypothetical protein D3C73_636930 [compost metagenome]
MRTTASVVTIRASMHRASDSSPKTLMRTSRPMASLTRPLRRVIRLNICTGPSEGGSRLTGGPARDTGEPPGVRVV